MLALLAVACAAGVVAFALRGRPWRIGLLRALVGLVTLVGAGYAWVLLMWTAAPRLAPLFGAIPGVHLKGLVVFVLFLAPPTLLALAAVRLVGRDAPRARMAG